MSFEIKNHFVIAIDLDNTLTNGEPVWDGIIPTPHKEHIELIRKLFKKGYIIIIHTARQWEDASETVGWLIANRIPFQGIMMGKMGADYYVDDRNCSFEDLTKLLDK